MSVHSDPAATWIKYIIFTVNFVIWVMGGGLLGLGVWIRSDDDFWEYTDNMYLPQYYQAANLIITVGALLLIIGFFGCCGAALESPCMLCMYMVILVFLLVMELAAAGLVWKYADGEKFQNFLTESIKDLIEKSKTDGQALRFIDLLQLHLQCCGGYDRNDYHMDDIPQSCSSQRTNNIFIHGCGENIRRYLEQKSGAIGGVALGLVLLEILCLIFTGCLFVILREDQRKTYY